MTTLQTACENAARRPKETAPIVHRVSIEPSTRNGHRQYFSAYLDGQQIVEKSPDPEFAACRAMAAMGLSGSVVFQLAGAKPGLVVRDLRKAARLCVVETDTRFCLGRWKPFSGNTP